MGYFDISLDNDITYLLSEIGNNVKINNVPAKAIISNINNTDDDKEIISDTKLKRGQYVHYNDLWFIVVSAVNDKRYDAYYKSIIRRCDNDIKIIIDNKLYQFPVFFKTGDMARSTSTHQMFIIFSDVMKMYVPATNIARSIKLQTRFVKFGGAWQVGGKNEMENGLMEINCSSELQDKNLDDYENEIGGRYDSNGKDILNENIIPIMPFDDDDDDAEKYLLTFNIKDKKKENVITDATIELKDTKEKVITILANAPHKIPKGTYTYTVKAEGYKQATGTIIVEQDTTKTILLEIDELAPPPDFMILLSGGDKLMVSSDTKYTANVLDKDTFVEVENKQVRFEIDDTSLAKIISQGDNKCVVKANDNFKYGKFTLKAILVDDEAIFKEKEVRVIGL